MHAAYLLTNKQAKNFPEDLKISLVVKAANE